VLSEMTGVPVLILPLEVGGLPGADDFISLYEILIQRIAGVLTPDPEDN
jgi:hypothetical protein